jgi:hypothetical protein
MSDIRKIHDGYVPPARDMKAIADTLRQVADAVESGKCGEVLHACVLMDNGRELLTMHRSTYQTTKMEWLGLLQCAIHHVMK